MSRSRRTQDAIILCTAIGGVSAILGALRIVPEPVAGIVLLGGLGAAATIIIVDRVRAGRRTR